MKQNSFERRRSRDKSLPLPVSTDGSEIVISPVDNQHSGLNSRCDVDSLQPDSTPTEADPKLAEAGPKLAEAGPRLPEAGPKLAEADPKLVDTDSRMKTESSKKKSKILYLEFIKRQ